MPGVMDARDRPALDHGFWKYQSIVTLVPIAGGEDVVIPAGSTGVIVDISLVADWFRIEFLDPAAVVGMTVEHVRPLPHDLSTRLPLHELDPVRTLVDVVEEGQRLPAGSTGTIVDVSRVSGWYEVESTEPFQAVVTFANVQVAPLAA